MLRILSDLHHLDASSRVKRLDQLDPLLDGVDRLVLNGDTCDTETGMTGADVAAVKAHFTTRVRDTVFLTGNHDPLISDTHELLLAGGRVWVTHGDLFFEDVTPWSRLQPDLVRRVADYFAASPGSGPDDIPTRLLAHRHACAGLPREFDPTARSLAARVHRTLATLFPPRQLLAMIDAWRTMPDRAAALAAAKRPAAQVIVTGHIHLPRIWRRPDGRMVINTGAFTPPARSLAVDLDDTVIRVRQVVSRRGGFHPGAVIAEIPLADPASPAVSGSA